MKSFYPTTIIQQGKKEKDYTTSYRCAKNKVKKKHKTNALHKLCNSFLDLLFPDAND